MIHTLDLFIPPLPNIDDLDKNIAAEIAMSYCSPRLGHTAFDTPIKRNISNPVWLPHFDPVCQAYRPGNDCKDIHFTTGDAQLYSNGSMWVRIDLCAAYYELLHDVGLEIRTEGYRSWLETDPVQPLKNLPKSLKPFIQRHDDEIRDDTARALLCPYDKQKRQQMREHVKQLDRMLLDGRSPYLLSPKQIVRILRLYLQALQYTWGHLDINSARITGMDVYFQWHVPGLRNFMPGLIQDITRKANLGVRLGDGWVEETTKRGDIVRAAYMLDNSGDSDGDILRLRFHILGYIAQRLGILDPAKLFTERAYSDALALEPLVAELQKRISQVRLSPCLNEVDLIRCGVHAIRSLYLFHHPELQRPYLSRKFGEGSDARRKEEARLANHPVKLLTAEQLRVPNAGELAEQFEAYRSRGPCYHLSELRVKEQRLDVVKLSGEHVVALPNASDTGDVNGAEIAA